MPGFGEFPGVANNPSSGGGGGGITEIESTDGSITVTNPTGPTVDIGTSGQSAVLRAFPFTHATPNLFTTGAPLYTPTPGDWLLTSWVSITQAFNGTTPSGNYGPLIQGSLDSYQLGGGEGPIDMTQVDEAGMRGPNPLLSGMVVPMAGPSIGALVVGARFTAADAVKMAITTNGYTAPTQASADIGNPSGALPFTVVTGTNDEFTWTGSGGGGSPETFTLAAATLTTEAEVITAMGAAVGSAHGEAFSTIAAGSISPTNSDIVFTMLTGGAAENGNTIGAGGNDFLAPIGLSGGTFAGGVDTGADPGSTQGEGVLYLVTATPV